MTENERARDFTEICNKAKKSLNKIIDCAESALAMSRTAPVRAVNDRKRIKRIHESTFLKDMAEDLSYFHSTIHFALQDFDNCIYNLKELLAEQVPEQLPKNRSCLTCKRNVIGKLYEFSSDIFVHKCELYHHEISKCTCRINCRDWIQKDNVKQEVEQ